MSLRIDLSFPHQYEVDPSIELPGSPGRIRQVYYPGASEIGGRNGLLVGLRPDAGEPWIGLFERGGLGGIGGVFSHPDTRSVCVVSYGSGYVVRVDEPGRWAEVSCTPITDVRQVLPQRLIIFATPILICAFSEHGEVWRTKRLVWDDLRIVEITADILRGTGWDAASDRQAEFTVDLLTGRHSGGASCL